MSTVLPPFPSTVGLRLTLSSATSSSLGDPWHPPHRCGGRWSETFITRGASGWTKNDVLVYNMKFIYTTWKGSMARRLSTPMGVAFIKAPYFEATELGSCAIYFHHSVSKKNGSFYLKLSKVLKRHKVAKPYEAIVKYYVGPHVTWYSPPKSPPKTKPQILG